MTSLERAARAAAEQYGAEWDKLPAVNPVENGELDQRHFVDQTRAVLQAIREPSEGMCGAGVEALLDHGCDIFIDAREAAPCWQAMIDAALEEG